MAAMSSWSLRESDLSGSSTGPAIMHRPPIVSTSYLVRRRLKRFKPAANDEIRMSNIEADSHLGSAGNSPFRVAIPGRQDAAHYGSQDGCRYSHRPTLNTYSARRRKEQPGRSRSSFSNCGVPANGLGGFGFRASDFVRHLA